MHRCVSIMSSAVSKICFVDLMPFCCLFVCPLSVAGHEFGRYFSAASAVRPGHVDSWLFLIAFNRVDFGGQKRHWCRYLMSSSFEDIWYALFAVCACVFF